MKKIILLALLIPSFLYAETARGIIKKVDKNQLFVTCRFSLQMTIHKGKRKLVKHFYGYAQKKGDKSFMEFTNPEDKGVKYLKLDDELWIYFPDADDIMKISGHMLKQGMMGSDISYEDMMETEHIEKKYNSKLLNDQDVNGRACYVIDLTARVPDATYARQVLYVDKKNYIPLKIDMYARGGRKIKVVEQSNLKKSGNRYYPAMLVIQDVRKRNSKTIMEYSKISFDIGLPAGIFSKRQLKR